MYRDKENRQRVQLQIPSPRMQQLMRDETVIQQYPSPFIPMTAMSGSTLPPNVQANPFMQALYAQKAGDFMFKQFEGLNRFTKSGLSVGEKSAVWFYTKFRAWSKKWFTHFFLFIVVTLYSIAGALIFMAIEGKSTMTHSIYE
jgi:hypothetical protein